MATTSEALTSANTALENARFVTHLSVDEAVRHTSATELEAAAAQLRLAKSAAIADGADADANRLLAGEFAVRGAISELVVLRALENHNPTQAWDALVEAQNQAAAACRTDPEAAGYRSDVERRLVLERVLFPPQTFMSAGMIIREADCSICGSSYAQCNHVKGYAYAGQMCTRVIKKAEFLEVSIVDEPADKRCLAGINGVDPLTLANPSAAG